MLTSVKLAKEITKFSLREAAGKSPHEGYIAIEKIRIRTPDAALALAWGMTQRSFRVRLACIQAAGRTARFPQILLPKLVAAVSDPDVAQEAVKALLHFPPTESVSHSLHQWAEPRKAYDFSPGPSESAVLWALNRLGSGRARVQTLGLAYLEAVHRGENWCSEYLIKPLGNADGHPFNFAHLTFIGTLLQPSFHSDQPFRQRLLTLIAPGRSARNDPKVYKKLFLTNLLTLCAHHSHHTPTFAQDWATAVKQHWPELTGEFEAMQRRLGGS